MRSASSGVLHSDLRKKQKNIADDGASLGRGQLSREMLKVQKNYKKLQWHHRSSLSMVSVDGEIITLFFNFIHISIARFIFKKFHTMNFVLYFICSCIIDACLKLEPSAHSERMQYTFFHRTLSVRSFLTDRDHCRGTVKGVASTARTHLPLVR